MIGITHKSQNRRLSLDDITVRGTRIPDGIGTDSVKFAGRLSDVPGNGNANLR